MSTTKSEPIKKSGIGWEAVLDPNKIDKPIKEDKKGDISSKNELSKDDIKEEIKSEDEREALISDIENNDIISDMENEISKDISKTDDDIHFLILLQLYYYPFY